MSSYKHTIHNKATKLTRVAYTYDEQLPTLADTEFIISSDKCAAGWAVPPAEPALAAAPQTTTYVTKDSGQRQEFATGSVRDTTEGKGSFVSISPHMLRRLAGLLERGAKKYGLMNYQKGQPFSRIADSLMRHTNQAISGDESEDHKAAVVFNAMAWIHYEEEIKAGRLPATLDDLPKLGGA